MNRALINEGCYAVIFSSRKKMSTPGYEDMDEKTIELAQQIDGFLGYESATGLENNIFISYWKTEEAINNWREHATHELAKKMGKKIWYQWYHSVICKIEKSTYVKDL